VVIVRAAGLVAYTFVVSNTSPFGTAASFVQETWTETFAVFAKVAEQMSPK
jgi:hypothetical protein